MPAVEISLRYSGILHGELHYWVCSSNEAHDPSIDTSAMVVHNTLQPYVGLRICYHNLCPDCVQLFLTSTYYCSSCGSSIIAVISLQAALFDLLGGPLQLFAGECTSVRPSYCAFCLTYDLSSGD